MNKELKKFIISIVLFVTGLLGSGLNLISNAIVLLKDGNNLIPIIMFFVSLIVAIVGLILMVKKEKNN